MPTHLVCQHSHPQADVQYIGSDIAKATSSIRACDNCDATTPLTHTRSLLNDNIHETACLTRVSRTSTASFPTTDLQTESMTTPTTPTTPSTPVTGAIDMEEHNMMDNNKAFDSNVAVSPKLRESNQKSRSRASSTSQRAARSASSSTAGNSRRHGTGAHRRNPSTQQLPLQQSPPGLHSRSSSTHMSPQKRDQLLALHRDSCRLFQPAANTTAINNIDPYEELHSHSRSHSTPFASPTASPVQRSHVFPFGLSVDSDMSDEDLLPSSSASSRHIIRTATATSHNVLPDTIDTVPETPEQQLQQQQSYVPPTTVITEWTSPSTRRREYEKIDRSNKGIRRIWRRLTPSCFQSGDNMRMPFFEEGNKKNYEGSVRRFRMDIPDDVGDGDGDGDNGNTNNFSEKTRTTTMTTTRTRTNGNGDGLLVSGPKAEKGKWSCF